MVTDAMIEAGATAFCETLSLDPRKLAEVVYTAMHEARPTADLGEEGELKPLDDILRDWENGANDAAGTIEDLVALIDAGDKAAA